jgi:hypothetical protein
MVFRLPITLPPVVRDLVPGVVSGPDAEAAGRRVLVTGASGTFGRAIAADLAGRGARVVGLDLAPRPDDVVEVIACDITDDASVASAVARAVEMLGGLDILARPAGLGLRAAAGRPRRGPRPGPGRPSRRRARRRGPQRPQVRSDPDDLQGDARRACRLIPVSVYGIDNLIVDSVHSNSAWRVGRRTQLRGRRGEPAQTAWRSRRRWLITCVTPSPRMLTP